jgi:hypothetical protein
MATTCERTRGMGRIPELVTNDIRVLEADGWNVLSLAIDIFQRGFGKDLGFWLFGLNKHISPLMLP